MAGVYAQLILKIPLRGNPSCFTQKKSKAHYSWSTSAWGCLPAIPFLIRRPWGNRQGNPSAYFHSWDNYSVIYSIIFIAWVFDLYVQEQAPTKNDTTTADRPTRRQDITELDPSWEPVEPSPSWYLDLGGIGGVIHLHISVADSITLLYVKQSYSLSIWSICVGASSHQE
jgi:hypothetical protein